MHAQTMHMFMYAALYRLSFALSRQHTHTHTHTHTYTHTHTHNMYTSIPYTIPAFGFGIQKHTFMNPTHVVHTHTKSHLHVHVHFVHVDVHTSTIWELLTKAVWLTNHAVS